MINLCEMKLIYGMGCLLEIILLIKVIEIFYILNDVD